MALGAFPKFLLSKYYLDYHEQCKKQERAEMAEMEGDREAQQEETKDEDVDAALEGEVRVVDWDDASCACGASHSVLRALHCFLVLSSSRH